jgi:hypothetical protein
VNNQTSQILVESGLEAALNSQQLLAVGEHKRSGLIICKAHHAEFAGPGAIVGTLVEQACVSVIAIGAPEIVPVFTHQQRQTAYSRRIQWIRWLQKITEHTDPSQRAEKLFASFEEFFGAQALMSLSDDVLALLIGVFPSTIVSVRSHYQLPEPLDSLDLPRSSEPMKFSAVRSTLRSPHISSSHTSTKTCASFLEALYNCPSRD